MACVSDFADRIQDCASFTDKPRWSQIHLELSCQSLHPVLGQVLQEVFNQVLLAGLTEDHAVDGQRVLECLEMMLLSRKRQ